MAGKNVMEREPDDEGGPDTNSSKPSAQSGRWAVWNSESAENLTRIGQRVVFVLAAIFAVYEYAQGRQDQAEEKAFELVTVWESREYQEAFGTVRTALSSAMATAGEIDLDAVPDDQIIGLQSRIGDLSLQGDTGPAVREAVDALIYFSGRVGFCSSRGLCDRRTLTEFFADTMFSLRAYYGGYIDRKRDEGAATFGEYLDRFLSEAGRFP